MFAHSIVVSRSILLCDWDCFTCGRCMAHPRAAIKPSGRSAEGVMRGLVHTTWAEQLNRCLFNKMQEETGVIHWFRLRYSQSITQWKELFWVPEKGYRANKQSVDKLPQLVSICWNFLKFIWNKSFWSHNLIVNLNIESSKFYVFTSLILKLFYI